jgi:hypothetical protein
MTQIPEARHDLDHKEFERMKERLDTGNVYVIPSYTMNI